MESVVILGADRAGKSTAIRNAVAGVEKQGKKCEVLHFTEVKPHHKKPNEQFINQLNKVDRSIDTLFLDRFASDTVFYEPYRYQMPPINIKKAQEAEDLLIKISDSVKVYLLMPPFDEDMVKRHEDELRYIYTPGCSDFWLKSQIEKRKIEHEEYYKFTLNHLNKTSNFSDVKILLLPQYSGPISLKAYCREADPCS